MKAIIPKRVIAFLFGIDYVAESAKSATQIFNNRILSGVMDIEK
jgi:hypothetical protein